MQMSPDKTYFITSSKDKVAKILDVQTLQVLKTFPTDTPLNSASLTPKKDFVILGGGQEARDVTTTSSRQGKFEARFYHKIFEDEIGRVRGHFGPLNTIAVHPAGTAYASGTSHSSSLPFMSPMLTFSPLTHRRRRGRLRPTTPLRQKLL